eukprot:gene50007-18130_t
MRSKAVSRPYGPPSRHELESALAIDEDDSWALQLHSF